jgi:hypothetical protein
MQCFSADSFCSDDGLRQSLVVRLYVAHCTSSGQKITELEHWWDENWQEEKNAEETCLRQILAGLTLSPRWEASD